jgi:hypothetical protein
MFSGKVSTITFFLFPHGDTSFVVAELTEGNLLASGTPLPFLTQDMKCHRINSP